MWMMIEGDVNRPHAERMLVCCHNVTPASASGVVCCGKPAVAWRYSHDVTKQLCNISPSCEAHQPPKYSAKKRKLWGIIDLVKRGGGE